jgi:hypothetical protein
VSRPVSGELFLFFLDFDNFTAFVMAALGANTMRLVHLTAVAAFHQIGGIQRVMRATAIATAR